MGDDGITNLNQMNNIFIKALFSVFLVSLFSITIAQLPNKSVENDWFWNNKQATQVIAQNGLVVRAAPSKNADRLGKLAFGTSVKYLDNDIKLMDSLYVEKTDSKTIQVCGAWRKIEYQGKAAYVNSAFLYRPLHPSKYEPNLNTDYALLLYGANCINNVKSSSEYFWYGYYNIENQSCQLRQVDIDFVRTEGSYADINVIVQDDQDLKFIIGSKKKLNTGEINEWATDGFYNKLTSYKITGIDSTVVEDPFFEIHTKTKDEQFTPYGILKYNDKKQEINNEAYGYINGYTFIGDIDGDGRPDYIIPYGEKTGRTILYLSSERGPGELAKAVAAYHTGYCC